MVRKRKNAQGNQVFMCNECKRYWITNRKFGIDLGQKCPRCNSTHVQKRGISDSDKQQFRCVGCDRSWSVKKTLLWRVYEKIGVTTEGEETRATWNSGEKYPPHSAIARLKMRLVQSERKYAKILKG